MMADSHRMLASLSFVGVLLFVGLPLWWKTTEVYRVSLPYKGIANLDNYPFKFSMTMYLAVQNQTRGVEIKRYLENAYQDSENFYLKFEVIPRPSKLNLSLEKLDKGPGTLVLVEWPLDDVKVRVTPYRVVLYSLDAPSDIISQVLSEWILSVSPLRDALRATSYSRHDEATRKRIPPSEAFDVTLSVVAPGPEKIEVDWNPKEAVEDYLEPFVSELSIIHNFTLKSQWLYFVQLDFNPKQIPDDSVLRRHYALPEETLPHLITPLEKKLASHISKNPCLNLVLYTPSCEDSPIYIYNKKEVRTNGKMEAFLSPRWGGIVIGNPPASTCAPYLENPDTVKAVYHPPTGVIMGYFLAQLRVLLGIPQQNPINGASLDPLTTPLPRKWELDVLARIRTVEQVVSAKLTLKSLSQLLGEISNIVINDDVGAFIYRAVENVGVTNNMMKNGKLLDALESSRSAFLSAEAAFSDPTLLALLYFPDDQKYAVYMPLFLPIMIPVLMSMKSIIAWLKTPQQIKKKTE